MFLNEDICNKSTTIFFVNKSTSGIFLAMVGPNTFFPLAAKAQKQTAVAHSTVEAEIVSANFAVRTIGLPALDLWETVFERSVALTLIEDTSPIRKIFVY